MWTAAGSQVHLDVDIVSTYSSSSSSSSSYSTSIHSGTWAFSRHDFQLINTGLRGYQHERKVDNMLYMMYPSCRQI